MAMLPCAQMSVEARNGGKREVWNGEREGG